jgi:ubiquinone/menaquinone biosynthesis C-methylase UbiE
MQPDKTIMTKNTPDSIKAHWDEIADKWKSDPQGMMQDTNLRELEFQTVVQCLGNESSVLDLGCGSGAITLKLAQAVPGNVLGLDFSPKMIEQANQLLSKQDPSVQERVRFQLGDVTNLSLNEKFSTIISFRCLINLADQDSQKKAIANIGKHLEANGQALISEDTAQGYNAINAARKTIGLPKMAKHWNNTPIDEALVKDEAEKNNMELVEIADFSSTYYLVSRAVNIKFAEVKNEGVEFYPELDDIAAKLPAFGNFGLLRLIKLRKLPA